MVVLLSVFQTASKEYFSRKGAKTQRKPLETRQRFAPLRLCARNILGIKQF